MFFLCHMKESSKLFIKALDRYGIYRKETFKNVGWMDIHICPMKIQLK